MRKLDQQSAVSGRTNRASERHANGTTDSATDYHSVLFML